MNENKNDNEHYNLESWATIRKDVDETSILEDFVCQIKHNEKELPNKCNSS